MFSQAYIAKVLMTAWTTTRITRSYVVAAMPMIMGDLKTTVRARLAATIDDLLRGCILSVSLRVIPTMGTIRALYLLSVRGLTLKQGDSLAPWAMHFFTIREGCLNNKAVETVQFRLC
mmetsp:Transcript_36824/g.84845  ORF Transcript_36824/g.84845 Transcript_36824/m.84845 type:complete len:118 (+) Transcript_36824:239-592(+)